MQTRIVKNVFNINENDIKTEDANKDGIVPMQEIHIGPKIKQTTFIVPTPLKSR